MKIFEVKGDLTALNKIQSEIVEDIKKGEYRIFIAKKRKGRK